MWRNREVRPLKHGEVQKEILADPPKIRPKEDQLGPSNKYRDETFKIYNEKKTQFLEASKKYNKLSQETLICCKQRLIDDYVENLDCKFLNDFDEDCKSDCICDCNTKVSSTGKLERKRTERAIHQVVEQPDDVCRLEPWFKRYLKLNKFIWAARKIILKNRLLTVLEKLKTVTAEDVKELENRQRRFLNVSYAEIFEKFL